MYDIPYVSLLMQHLSYYQEVENKEKVQEEPETDEKGRPKIPFIF